jgi:hypothetical protein
MKPDISGGKKVFGETPGSAVTDNKSVLQNVQRTLGTSIGRSALSMDPANGGHRESELMMFTILHDV